MPGLMIFTHSQDLNISLKFCLNNLHLKATMQSTTISCDFIHTVSRATTTHDAITWNTNTNNTTHQYQANNYDQKC